MTSCGCFSGLMMQTPPSTPTSMRVNSTTSVSSAGSKSDGLQGLIESVSSWHIDAVDANGMGEVERRNSKEYLSTASLGLMRRNSKDGIRKIWDDCWSQKQKEVPPSYQSIHYRISYHSTLHTMLRVIAASYATKILGMTSITLDPYFLIYIPSPLSRLIITWAYDMAISVISICINCMYIFSDVLFQSTLSSLCCCDVLCHVNCLHDSCLSCCFVMIWRIV